MTLTVETPTQTDRERAQRCVLGLIRNNGGAYSRTRLIGLVATGVGVKRSEVIEIIAALKGCGLVRVDAWHDTVHLVSD